MISVFRAGANAASPQSGIPNAAYTAMQLRTDFNYAGVSGIDTGAEFNNATSIWTPKAGPISWSAQVWALNFGGGVNQNLVLTVFKNGVDFHAGIGGMQVATFVNSGSANNSGMDVASGTDQYQLRIYMTTFSGANNGQLNADPRHVWWNGMSFGS